MRGVKRNDQKCGDKRRVRKRRHGMRREGGSNICLMLFPKEKRERKWSRGSVLSINGKNFLEPMSEYLKGCIEPFNGQLWFGGRTLCFRQPRAQKILTGDCRPSLFLDTRHKTQDTGHKKRVRNQLLPLCLCSLPPAASSSSFFLPQVLLPSH